VFKLQKINREGESYTRKDGSCKENLDKCQWEKLRKLENSLEIKRIKKLKSFPIEFCISVYDQEEKADWFILFPLDVVEVALQMQHQS